MSSGSHTVKLRTHSKCVNVSKGKKLILKSAMDKHVLVTVICAFLYLIVISTIETISIICRNALENTKNESYIYKMSENLTRSIINGDLFDAD